LRRNSEQQEVDDEVSSFEEVNAQKKFMKKGKIEMVENARFMTEARRKELERRQRQKKESTPVVKEEKEKRKFFAVSSSSQERVSRRRRDPAACGRAGISCIHCSSIRRKATGFSFKTEQFSFDR
jgi:hypothetical protein